MEKKDERKVVCFSPTQSKLNIRMESAFLVYNLVLWDFTSIGRVLNLAHVWAKQQKDHFNDFIIWGWIILIFNFNISKSEEYLKLLQRSSARHWRRQWHPTLVLLPGKSHRWRSLVGCSPWGCEESDTTERLHFHFLLSCIGEGNGNPLHCSCLENPRDGGAWWAAVSGVAQSWTRLKRFSSSSSSARHNCQVLYLCTSPGIQLKAFQT